MSLIFQTVLHTGKFYYNKSLRTSFSSCKCLSLRKYSDNPKKFQLFNDVVVERRAEAKRSLVVQVNSESSFDELFGYCSKYSDINGINHYRNSAGEHFMLIELKSEDSLKDLLSTCSSHQKDVEVLATRSPFLWFRAAAGQKKKLIAPTTKSLLTKDGNQQINEEVLFEELSKCSTMSDQIQMLYDKTKLNDLGVRLRFMVARHLEMLFESLYANVEVKPFGSSVNGFGKMGCDLDLVLTNEATEEMCAAHKRLVYQEKRCSGGGGRGSWQRQLELAAELLEARAPGVQRVQRILHARVPIVKFAHQLAAVECDLAYTNVSGVHMSELMWLCGVVCGRARALSVAVRRWAAAAQLTSGHPGRWITNFPLTLMVLFFLQRAPGGPLLPPIDELVRRAGKEDIRIAEDNINCTFLRDMNKLPAECYDQNDASLETLLQQFFEFYAQFDFQEKAISINEGAAIRKPNSQPLYIVNPLDQSLNVSRNVSYEECQRLQAEIRNAAWQLESALEAPRSEDWGLLCLIERKATKSLKKLIRAGNSHRLVSVKDLFKDNDDVEVEGEGNKQSKLSVKSNKEIEDSVRVMKTMFESQQGASTKKEPLKYKSRQVANEVQRIRRDKIL